MKTCMMCKQKKPDIDFGKDRSRKRGLDFSCRECVRKKDRTSKYRKIRRDYRLSEKGRLNTSLTMKRYREKNKEKCRARSLFKDAVKSGSLKRGLCEICGDSKVDGHHGDYEKPLEVRWLCKKHHVEHHRKLRDQERMASRAKQK